MPYQETHGTRTGSNTVGYHSGLVSYSDFLQQNGRVSAGARGFPHVFLGHRNMGGLQLHPIAQLEQSTEYPELLRASCSGNPPRTLATRAHFPVQHLSLLVGRSITIPQICGLETGGNEARKLNIKRMIPTPTTLSRCAIEKELACERGVVERGGSRVLKQRILVLAGVIFVDDICATQVLLWRD